MAADGSITAVVNLDVNEAEKRVNKLGRDIVKLQDKLSINKNKRNVLAESLKETQKAIEEVRQQTSVVGDKFITSPENITKMQELQEKIKQIEADIAKCDAQSEKWNTELEAMQEHYGEIEKEARKLSGTVGNGDNLEQEYSKKLEQARADIESAIEKIKREWIEPLPELMRTITDSISPKIGETFDKLASKAGEAFRSIKEAAKGAIDAEIGEQYLQDWKAFFDKLSDKAFEFGKDAAAHILVAFRNIKENLPDIGESIMSGLQNILPQITSALEGGGIGELASKLFSGLAESIAAISSHAAIAVEAIKLLTAAFKRLWEQAVKDSVMLVNGITTGFKALVSAIKESPAAIKRFAISSNSSLKKVAKLFASITKNVAETLKNINLFSKLSEKLTKVLNKLGSMIRRVFVYSVLTSFFRALRTQMSEYLSLNADFMNALGRLKSALATAFQPILNVVIPALTALVNMLTKVISVIAQFIAALFGTTAKQAQANAKALSDQAKATEAAGDAAKKASQQLAGFDEINTLSFDDDSAGGAAGAIGELGDALYDLDLDDTWFKSWGEAFDAFLDRILNEGIPALKDALNGFADWLNWLSGNLLEMFTFPGIKDKLKKVGEEIGNALNDMINRINWDQLGRAIGAGLDDAIAFLLGLLDTLDFMNLGKKLAELINGLLDMVDWYEFGRLLWSGFKIALETLAGLLENLNMPKLAQAASDVIIGFFDAMKETIDKIHWDVIGQQIATFLNNIKWYDIIVHAWDAISAAINSVFVMARNFIDSLHWDDIATQIYRGINDSIGKLHWADIGRTIGDGFEKVFTFVKTVVSGINWHQIGENIATFILEFDIVSALGAFADMIAAGINAAMELACGMLDLILPEAFNIGNGIAERIRNAVESVEWAHLGYVVGNAIKTALNLVAGLLNPDTFYQIGKAIGDFLINLDWPGILEGLGRAIANGIKSAVALIRGFLDSLQPNLKQVATDIADKINNFVKSVDWKELGKTIHDGIKAALDFLLTILQNLDWKSIGKAIVDFFTALDWPGLLAEWQKVIGTAIGGALNGIDLGDALTLGMNLVGGILQGAINKFNAEGGILGWIKRIIFEPFINAFKSLFGIHSPSTVMEEQGGYIIEGLLLGITNAWEGIASFFTEALAALKEMLSEAWNNIKESATEAWNSIKEAISTAWNNIKEAVNTAVENVKETISTAWENIKSAASEAWENIKSTIHEKLENIKTAINEAVENIKTKIKDAWDNIKQTTSSIWDSIKTTLQQAWENIKSAAQTAFNSIKETISNVWNTLKSDASAKWNEIKTTLLNTWNEIKTTATNKFQEIKQSITDKFSELRNHDWKSIGQSIVDKFMSGLETIWNTLRNWASKVRDAISDAISGAKNAVSNVFGGGNARTYSTVNVNTIPVQGLENITIPRLAAGAVIPPNREFMAVLGDQNRGNNLEAPEALIRKIVREESGGNNEQLLSVLETLNSLLQKGFSIDVDGATFGRVAIDTINNATARAGRPLLKV